MSRFGADPVQLEWQALGRGIVGLVVVNAQLTEPIVVTLAYPQQGQHILDPPIDEKNAAILTAATVDLNLALRKVCS